MNERHNAWTARLLKVFSMVLVAVLCVAAPVALTGCGSSSDSSSDTTTDTSTSEATTDQVTVTQKVGDGDEQQVAIEKDATVLDVLKASGVSYQSEDGSYGEYVTSIDGKAAEGNSGWSYTVNGEEPSVGAGDYKVADGDAIVWSYVTYSN